MFDATVIGSVGDFQVHVANGRTKTAQEWGQEVADKVIFVADTAPAEIRDQAHAFRDRVMAVVAANVEQAVLHERQACAALAEQNGSPMVAMAIRTRI